jgi:hypothetical protein
MPYLFYLVGTLVFVQSAAAEPRSTASEIFQLRTECARLAKEYFREHTAQGAFANFESRYDPDKNKCFVVITHVNQDTKTTNASMFDVHRNVMLAYCSRDFKGTVLNQTTSGCTIIDTMKDD